MNDDIDLGSAPEEDFNPFADEEELDDDGTLDSVETAASKPDESEPPRAQAPKPRQTKEPPVSAPASGNPLENAIAEAETKDAEKTKQSLFEKLPVFEFAGASEDITDSSITFDELRIAKAADFPELDDGKRVSWTVEYGKITKSVTDAKGTSISKIKSEIEASKEFTDALKKSKDKDPVCKVKPRVTAQSKGSPSASYKDVFTRLEDVEAAGKVISILPAKDGKVYEVRNNPLGRFITPVVGCELLSDVKAGFTPASGIPLIPMSLMLRIISFFRCFIHQDGDNEALVNVYWDTLNKEFIIDTPEQIVSRVSVHSKENPDYQNERFIHFMDIHSHNKMKAYFSVTDDKDEKGTRLYTVIGRLDSYFPEIKTRISNGGKFHEIDPAEVFEHIAYPFPPEWMDKVMLRSAHKDADNNDGICECFANQYPFCKGNDENGPWCLNNNKDSGD